MCFALQSLKSDEEAEIVKEPEIENFEAEGKDCEMKLSLESVQWL